MLKELTCSPSFFDFHRGNRTIQINQVITTKTTEHCCHSQISHMPSSNCRPSLPYISVKVGYATVHFQDAILCCPVQDAILCCPVQDAILCCPVQDVNLCCPVQDANLCYSVQDAILCCPVQDANLCYPVQDAILCCPVQDVILLSSSRCYLVCVLQLKMLSCVCSPIEDVILCVFSN